VDQPSSAGHLPEEASGTPPGAQRISGLRRPRITASFRPAGEMCVFQIIVYQIQYFAVGVKGVCDTIEKNSTIFSFILPLVSPGAVSKWVSV